MKGYVFFLAGWFVPGLGHLLQKKYWRGAIFLVAILAMTGMGLIMGGKIYPLYLEKPRTLFQIVLNLFKKENPLTLLAFLADLGNLLIYGLSRVLAFGQGALERSTFEFGTAYIAGAGLLNYLIALDAFDIARGKKK
ncbi:MAG: DUF6677 family protein [Candidatus Aminicenantales bacterium]